MNTGIVLVDVAVKDLSGAALDWAVGTAEQFQLALTPPNYGDGTSLVYIVDTDPLYRPSTDWSWCGQLRDKYRVEVLECGEVVYAKLAGLAVAADEFGATLRD